MSTMKPVSFSEIIGNENVKRQFNEMISKKTIVHALLFSGPSGVGKSLFAWALAAQVLSVNEDRSIDHVSKIRAGMHPDVHEYKPEGKLGLHTIQSLREMCEEIYLPPLESRWKVFIIHEADRMLSYSANALLKTFEEPPPRTLIILLSSSRASLLPTILSRCLTVHFQSLSSSLIQNYLREHYSLEDQLASNIAVHSQGSMGRALRLMSEGDTSRVEIFSILANAPFSSYRALQESVQKLNERMEAKKQQAEDEAKQEMRKIFSEQLSAQQQQAVEKEIEGATSLIFMQEVQALFENVLLWYRDIHLLSVGGSSALLKNPDFQSEITQAFQRGKYKPLQEVYQILEEALLSIRRSTAFSICMENILLKLSLISGQN